MASLTSYSSPSDSSTAGDITTMDLDFLDDLLLQANDNEDDWELAQLAIDAVINSLDNHHSSGIPMAPPLEPTAVAPALPSSSTMYALQSESFVTPQPSFQHNQQPTLTNSHATTNDDDDDFEEDDFEVEEEPPANLSPSDLAAIRRLRHREAMQRCRQRKRSRMGSLEKQRKQMKALLKQRLLEHQHREEREARLQHGDKAPPLPQIERLRRMFARVVNLKEALLDERQGLEESLREHQKFERIVMQSTTHIVNDPTAKLGSLLGGPTANDANMDDSMEEEASSSGQDSTDGPGLPSASSSRRKGPAGHWVQYVDDEPPLFYEPESTESIDEHVRECYQRVRRLQHAFDVNLIVAKETHCLGWRAQHSLSRVDQQVELRFRFRRRVPLTRLSLEELQQASWKVMRDPVQNARLYSSLVVCKIVQYVGENTFIFLRNAPDKDKRLHIRYFSMHSQMEYSTTDNERAFMTLMKILDKDPHILEPSDDMPAKKPPTPVIWLKDGTLFMNFTEKKEDGQIEIEYGGAVHCPSEDHARYLMVEVGGVLMRWEQFVVPQQLLPF